MFEGCPINDCFATSNKRHVRIEDFDAIIFHGAYDLSTYDLPSKRSKKQFYIYVSLESPENYPEVRPIFEEYFNLTMTYRTDSDIPWPYAVVRSLKGNNVIAPLKHVHWDNNIAVNHNAGIWKPQEVSMSNIVKGKRKMVSWFVSNCAAKSGRMEYVTELSNYIDVDIYGKCGQKSPCENDCFSTFIEPNYYFYLSFENSLCEDYVTEKFYNALRYNIVPVVYGGANYTKFAPPGSYINSLDFDSPKMLAEFLLELSKNHMKYEKYFEWKKYYKIDSSLKFSACKLCEFLHSARMKQIDIPLSAWYHMDRCPIQAQLNGEYATKFTLNKLLD
ncbi:alpha-(1,3)-fucosyltransferase C isoform X2 [Prorops nasuta]